MNIVSKLVTAEQQVENGISLDNHLLASFNIAIVLNVRRSDRNCTVKALVLFTTKGNRAEIVWVKSRLRVVTRMLFMVVCTYLAANIIDVVISFWEVSMLNYM
ncbi:hypothetical protein DICVIV_14065 [Dictyocaulus viviparus]|uniref:Uncharacterized protein n=1 Tax=Dictyocaulus viviparus TaxID=29172 RepID=A0A0D8X8B1_DICVI|nr:hypothetical protein DICVIV_14065 [Dictyocaulus viviparus]